MNTVTSYLLALSTVLLGVSPFTHQLRTGPVQPAEEFCLGSPDLELTGPCYEVPSGRDAMLLTKPGVESFHPMPLGNLFRPIASKLASDSIPSDSIVFRVQIITSLYENSFPTVFIEGEMYNTYEYFYMGSYRITVGKFATLKEAQEFRLKCLNSGFKQAFVAAFRGDTRVTDPSVFKE